MIDNNDPEQLGLAILSRMKLDKVSACEAADRTYNDMKVNGWSFALPDSQTWFPSRPPKPAAHHPRDPRESV